jgi:hypothetical protein
MIMSRQTLRWVLAWTVLAVAVVVAVLWSKNHHLGLVAQLVIFVVGVLTLVRGRTVLKRFPPERRITVDRRRIGLIERYLVPGGVISFVAGLAWMLAFARLIPDSKLGVAFLFGPSIALVVLGCVAIWFRVIIWLFGD